ncbi:lysoplasmalogenase [Rhodobacteraceae bacterium D3-12]|nr:lysoplasmalogenase [Rhodobacteraceae bacterium D3-12]
MFDLLPLPGVLPATLIATLLALIYLLAFCYRLPSWPKTLVKTGAVLALALAAWLANGPGMLLVALLLCALGDYLLSRPSEGAFMAGVGAFAAGHIAYVVLFLGHPLADLRSLLNTPETLLIAALIGVGIVMARLLWPRTGDLRWPVMVYIPVILSMGGAVMTLPQGHPLILAHLAALLFIVSDVTLSVEMFVLPVLHPLRRVLHFVIWSTYWSAQALFFLAFAGLSAT